MRYVLAAYRDPAQAKNVESKLKEDGILFQNKEIGIVEYVEGAPRTADVHMIFIEAKDLNRAAALLEIQPNTSQAKIACVQCSSLRVEWDESYFSWLIPRLFTVSAHGIPGRLMRCADCQHEWRLYTRPSI